MKIISDETRPFVPLYVTMFLEAMGSGLISAVLIVVARDELGCNNTQVGIIWSSYNAALILGSVGMGYLSDFVRRKYVLMLTLLWVAASYVVTGFASSFQWLLITRIATGLCGGPFPIAASILSSNLPGDILPAAIGRLGTATSLGFAIGPLFSTAISAAWPDSRGSVFFLQRIEFFIAAAIYCLAALLASRLCSVLTAPSVSVSKQESGGRVSAGLCLVWSSRFFSTCAVTTIYVTQVFLWKEFLGFDRLWISLTTTASGLTVSLCQGLLFPRLVKRLGFHAALTLGIASIGLANALLGPITSTGIIPLHYLCLVVFWFGLACMEPGTPVAVAAHLKNSPSGSIHTGFAMGITGAMKYAASLAMPPLAGLLFDQYKLVVYYVGAGVAFMGVGAVLAAWRLFRDQQLVKTDPETGSVSTEPTDVVL
jgi:MFS family permease